MTFENVLKEYEDSWGLRKTCSGNYRWWVSGLGVRRLGFILHSAVDLLCKRIYLSFFQLHAPCTAPGRVDPAAPTEDAV